MRHSRVKRLIGAMVLAAVGAVSLPPSVCAQTAAARPQQRKSVSPSASASSSYCAPCVRTNLSYLAGPELHGRGSGTEDEHHAARFIARRLKQYGLAPAAEDGQYIQTATLRSRAITKAPVLSFDDKAGPATWTHGNEMVVSMVSEPEVAGPLQKLDLSDETTTSAAIMGGAVVLLKLKQEDTSDVVLGPYLRSKAAVVIIPERAGDTEMFEQRSQRLPRVRPKMDDQPDGPARIIAKPEAAAQLWTVADGALIKLHTDMTPWTATHAWNVLARIQGRSEKNQIVLLSAHLDHLGIRNGKTYPGADDDASGTAAVMELARVLAKALRPRRTIVVALWGSEETGLVGARYFLKHPTFDLQDIIANLEFEMIARPDPKLSRGQLWLTGWERTDLGPELAAHGAKLVGDPHPEQGFFTRSDNYALARDGIVAQTASSYGLHQDYHQPGDTLAKVDWQHLHRAVAAMIAPVEWLANSVFVPAWKEGMKPQ